MLIITYLILGALAGILSGLLGVGGGLVVVPGLIMSFKKIHFIPEAQAMHMVIGSSFVIMLFTTATSAFVHIKRKLVSWVLFKKIIPYICLGLLLGLFAGHYLSSKKLQILFSCFLILLSCYMFYSTQSSSIIAEIKAGRVAIVDSSRPLIRLFLIIICLAVGMIAGFFGIGGSSLIVPYLLYLGEKIHHATGTAVMCAFPISIIGTISSAGFYSNTVNVVGATGFIYWPAVFWISFASICFVPLGTKLCVSISEQKLKRIFALLMLITGSYLLI